MLPYKCNYCGQYFCDEHRLPEEHLCPGLPKRSWKNFRTLQAARNPELEKAYTSRTLIKDKIPSRPTKKPKTATILIIIIVGVCLILYLDNPERVTSISVPQIVEEVRSGLDELAGQIAGSLEQIESQRLREQEEFCKEIAYYVLVFTNEQRVKHGLTKLIWDEDLAEIATLHSEDMVENDYFSHINLKGEDPTARAKKHGYNTYKDLGGGWYSDGIAENIGKMATGNVAGIGYVSKEPDEIAKAMVQSWMESGGHRENILNSHYDRLGVGVAYDGLYYIITQNFW